MSISFKDVYCTLWQTKTTEQGFLKGSISTSRKDKKNDGKYINSSWNVTFMGDAAEKIDGLPEQTRLKILSGVINNEAREYEDGKKFFMNVTIFDVEVVENNNSNRSASNNKPISAPKNTPKPTENQAGDEIDDDELPFK